MNKTEFGQRAAAALQMLERAIEQCTDAADVDVDLMRQGNVLQVTFEDGSQMVINSHEAASELWVASRAGGYHLRWDEAAADWRDTRSGAWLRPLVSAQLSLHAGEALTL